MAASVTWHQHPIFSIGFRPFFLVAAIWAVVAMGLWFGLQWGLISLDLKLAPTYWHAHSMIYGFAVAVFSGFLLTASANWTGLSPRQGWPLLLLASLWIGGRICSFPWLPSWLWVAVELAYIPCFGWCLWPYLSQANQRRNAIFWLFLLLLWIGDILVQLETLGLANTAQSGLYLGFQTMVMVIVLIAGRIIPFFAQRAIPGLQLRTRATVEMMSVLSALLFGIADSIPQGLAFLPALAVVTAIIHALRFSGWCSPKVFQIPILSILYAGYVFIILGYVSRVLDLPRSTVTHLFTVGGIGILCYGMMTRVALGHTGRVIHASAVVRVGYGLLVLACLARVGMRLAGPEVFQLWSTAASSLFWIGAFSIFVLKYAPILWRPRV